MEREREKESPIQFIAFVPARWVTTSSFDIVGAEADATTLNWPFSAGGFDISSGLSLYLPCDVTLGARRLNRRYNHRGLLHLVPLALGLGRWEERK